MFELPRVDERGTPGGMPSEGRACGAAAEFGRERNEGLGGSVLRTLLFCGEGGRLGGREPDYLIWPLAQGAAAEAPAMLCVYTVDYLGRRRAEVGVYSRLR
ncbi:unnamed protein product [Ostreobium quekettii]|uniref:Uncharacterized protein n=1 Tax=Ostreobium quekettii TaxID=121088 RepID=A0A8S1J1V2_9CHLO|nr:unnamed protein product [Ostreobium quekettii]